MNSTISVRQVHKHFGSLHALRGVDLEIGQGEFFGLLGPNGAGKSTLINVIGGLVHASSGQVSVMGHDVLRHWRQARASLGIVPQELVYDPFFSVRQLLMLQSGYFGQPPSNAAWVDELIETLGLADKAHTNMHDLSGGMKRRVLVAQALVHRPPVVILDEPTAGVDVELRKALWKFVRKLHAEGHTIVLTTHYLEEAESLCERIAILDHGEVRALDTKDDMLGRHPWRLLCLEVSNDNNPLPEQLVPLVEVQRAGHLELRLNKTSNHMGDVLDALRSAGWQVNDLHIREPGLEEVFIELLAEPGHD